MKKYSIAKIAWFAVAIMLILYFVFFLYKSNETQSSSTVIKVAVSATEPLFDAPFIIPYKKGFFAKHRVNVEMVSLGGGGDIKQALATGHVDIGATAMINFLIAASKGAPVKIIAFKNVAPMYLYVNPNSCINTFQDLEGKIIGTRPDGSGALLINFICKREGVDSTSLRYLKIDKATGPLALMERKIVDAIPISPGMEEIYDAAGTIRHREWEEKGYSKVSFTGTTVFSIIAVNTDSIAADPDAYKKFIDAYIDGHMFIKQHPNKAAEILAQYSAEASGGAITPSANDIKKTMDEGALKYLLWCDPIILEQLSIIATDTGMIKNTLSLHDILDDRFQNKLSDAQNDIYTHID